MNTTNITTNITKNITNITKSVKNLVHANVTNITGNATNTTRHVIPRIVNTPKPPIPKISTNINISAMPKQTIQPIQYTTHTIHAISLPEVILAVVGFIYLAYWYIRVSKDKEYYEHWTNPNGREVNLYKIIRIGLYVYTGVIMLLGIIQILLLK